MKRLIEQIKSLAWDRIALLGSAGAILVYVDWRVAVAVMFVSWAIIRGINDVMRNVAAALATQDMGLQLVTKEVLNIKQRVRTMEGGGDYVH